MQRYFAKNKNNDILILNEEDFHHIKTVMRMNLGDSVEVVFDEKLFLGEIIDISKNVLVKIIKEIENEEVLPNVFIAQALVKEQKMDFILQKATELGVSGVIPVSTTRSIVKINEKMDKKNIRWQKIVKEASEQSKRVNIPLVDRVLTIDEIAKLDYDVKILCTVNELSRSIKKVLQKVSIHDRIIIVVGPEGGFTTLEEETLVNAGYVPITLGNTVLRTETVALYVLSCVRYQFMR